MRSLITFDIIHHSHFLPCSQPVQASTGAIPKSISFDKTADKDDDSLSSESKTVHAKRDRGFFKTFKLPKIGRRGGGRGNKADDFLRVDRLAGEAFNIPEHSEGPTLFREQSLDSKASQLETSEDILAKYRKKPDEDKTDSGNLGILNPRLDEEVFDPTQKIDRENIEASFVFQDARRKLRLVLSEVSGGMCCGVCDLTPLQVDIPEVHTEKGRELLCVLNIMLAKAINLQDRSGAAQIRETLRCISLLEPEHHGKLILSLREEYRARSPYIAYLVRSRQGLLASQAALDSLCRRMEIEQRMSSKFLITVCVR